MILNSRTARPVSLREAFPSRNTLSVRLFSSFPYIYKMCHSVNFVCTHRSVEKCCLITAHFKIPIKKSCLPQSFGLLQHFMSQTLCLSKTETYCTLMQRPESPNHPPSSWDVWRQYLSAGLYVRRKDLLPTSIFVY